MNTPVVYFIVSFFLAAAVSAITPDQVKVKIGVQDSKAVLSYEVTVRSGYGASTNIDVTMRNNTGGTVALGAIEIVMPWLEGTGEELLISSGASNMMAAMMTNVEAGRGVPVPPSSMYLMAKNGGEYSLAGFLSWKTFSSYLQFDDGNLIVTADGEGRTLGAGETLALERICLAAGGSWQDLLFTYADSIAKELNIRLPEPTAYIGWSTWDYYGRDWTLANVLDNARKTVELIPSANLIQIDGGWWPQRGDFMDAHDRLQPGGMKALSRHIRELGLVPGIHFDGVRGDRKSEVAKKHPEYFLKDGNGDLIHDTYRQARDLLENIYFDFSHPEARDYMRSVVRNMRINWGYVYIKIDFLLHALNEDIRRRAFRGDASQKIVPHDPRLTSVERLRLALETFREAMGPDAFFLACTAPIGIAAGFADGFRTGPDISPNMQQFRINTMATGANFYLHGKVYHNDADYVVSRSAEDEDHTLVSNPKKSGGNMTLNEAEMWAWYVGLFGGPVLSGDNLPILREQRRELLRQAVALPKCDRFVPLDYWERGREQTDAFHVFLGEAKGRAYLALFNWSEEGQTYEISVPEGARNLRLETLQGGAVVKHRFSAASLRVDLPSRHAVVYALSEEHPFDQLRNHMRVVYRPN
jgi:alpha-galactosidase